MVVEDPVGDDIWFANFFVKSEVANKGQLVELALDVGEAYQQGIVTVVDPGDLDGLGVEHDRTEPSTSNL